MARSTLPTITLPTTDKWAAPTASWQHTGQSGQFKVIVDLIRGAGRTGALPDVKLAYQTSGPNGVFGLGWSLNTPAIVRGDGRHLPRFRDAGDDADSFSSSEFGELVPMPNEPPAPDADGLNVTRFRPRLDSFFVRIERRLDPATGGVYWLTISRDNVTRVYGRTQNACIADPGNQNRIAGWLLEEQWDSRGNRILFEYKREDLAGVSASSLSERHRFGSAHTEAQLHPKRIKWGNRRPHELTDWLFELVFDYGEHDGDSPDERVPWVLRPDAFSNYRNGFEVRTRRLCRRALLFYRFPELGDTPALIRAHEFSYVSTSAASLLTGVTLHSYRRESAGTLASESLPEVSFAYTTQQSPGQIRDVSFLDGRSAAGVAGQLQWHDLEGSALPGLLSREASGALHYRRNLGDGLLGSPEVLASRPSLTDTVQPATQNLAKLFGDGRSCLVEMTGAPGYQERIAAGAWLPYTPFPKSPSVRMNPAGARSLDLDGDGRADLMLANEFGVRWHRFNGREGWVAAQEVAATTATLNALGDRSGTVLLADMTGDGLADLVQVRPGNVRYWPNLGYGRFGGPVQMANSPLLDGPDQFDPARVRLFDIDGSGTADLIYLGRDTIACFANHGGNSFGPPRPINNLPVITDLNAVDVVDLLGTGTGCLVWSSILPGQADRPLRYLELTAGRPTNLLTSIRNGQGLELEINYTPSTRLMLDDRRAGKPWHSTLPFAIWLVTNVRETDLITGAAQITSSSYRHGCYDEVDREVRGFAYLEQREAQIVAPDPRSSTFDTSIPERVTRTWYHTGAHLDREQLAERLAAEFYSGDPARPARPGVAVENEFEVSPHELLRSLKGRPLREEVYGAHDGLIDPHPYTTVDYGYLVRALQPKGRNTYAAIATFIQETVERTYERIGAEPRVTQRVLLEIDRLGNPTRHATIGYAKPSPEQPEQRRSLFTVAEQDVVNLDDEADWYRAGVPIAARVFEVGPLPSLGSGRLFRVADLNSWLTAPDLVDLSFEQPLQLTGPPQRRLVSATKTRYWNEDLTAPAPFGTAGRLALPYEQRRAAFTESLLSNAYEGRLAREQIEASGYQFESGLWWAPGPRITYSPSAFYQPVSELTPLAAEYTVGYDAYGLFVTETRDPVGNVQRAQHDYQAMAAAVVTDANGATVSTAFDVLGLPTRVTWRGAHGEGDSLAAPTIEVSRDLVAWQRDRTPTSFRVSTRAQHGDSPTLLEQTINYLDGRGRVLQSKRLAEPEPEGSLNRWVVEKHTVLTASGDTVRDYAPGFTANDGFVPETVVADFPVKWNRLDALGRAEETQHANGARSRTVRTAWRIEHWDGNDAVAGSEWLRQRRRTGATAQQQAEADAAESHAATPTIEYLDPLGRTFLQVQNGGVDGLAETRSALTINGEVRRVTDARGVLTEQRLFDMLGQPLLVRSEASGTTRVFYDIEGEPVHAWGARDQEQRLTRDVAGRLLSREVRSSGAPWRTVERLIWGEQAPAGTEYQRGRLYLHYDGAGQQKISVYDFRGRPLQSERVFRNDLTAAADWSLLSGVATAVDIERAAGPLLSAERPFVTAAAFDAQDRLLSRTTPDGSVTRVDYNVRGLPTSITVTVDGNATEVLQAPVYDAAGLRLSARLGNGVREISEYVEGVGFLERRATTAMGGEVLRDLSLSYDAAGNVLTVADSGQQTRYFRNTVVSPNRSFRYDAFYRLVEAQGREAATSISPLDRASVPPLFTPPHDNDLTAVRRYTERYHYDLVGNITQQQHLAGSDGSWTIDYDIDPRGDRINGRSESDGTPIPGRLEYDEAGNATSLGGLNGLVWNNDEQLAQVDLEGGGTAYYTYDAAGQRRAKTIVRLDGLREERLYLDGYERFRRITRAGDIDQEETALHVADGNGRLLLVERRRAAGERTWTTLFRYQHSDQVGSSCLETDEAGRVLTFEEFRPYGMTAYHAAQARILPKRYRFGGQENDTETGLVLYGVRYYATWLGRWISADPGGMLDGTNRYWYCRSNPTSFVDPDGRQSIPQANSLSGPVRRFWLEEGPQGGWVAEYNQTGYQGRYFTTYNGPHTIGIDITAADIDRPPTTPGSVQGPVIEVQARPSHSGSHRPPRRRVAPHHAPTTTPPSPTPPPTTDNITESSTAPTPTPTTRDATPEPPSAPQGDWRYVPARPGAPHYRSAPATLFSSVSKIARGVAQAVIGIAMSMVPSRDSPPPGAHGNPLLAAHLAMRRPPDNGQHTSEVDRQVAIFNENFNPFFAAARAYSASAAAAQAGDLERASREAVNFVAAAFPIARVGVSMVPGRPRGPRGPGPGLEPAFEGVPSGFAATESSAVAAPPAAAGAGGGLPPHLVGPLFMTGPRDGQGPRTRDDSSTSDGSDANRQPPTAGVNPSPPVGSGGGSPPSPSAPAAPGLVGAMRRFLLRPDPPPTFRIPNLHENLRLPGDLLLQILAEADEAEFQEALGDALRQAEATRPPRLLDLEELMRQSGFTPSQNVVYAQTVMEMAAALEGGWSGVVPNQLIAIDSNGLIMQGHHRLIAEQIVRSRRPGFRLPQASFVRWTGPTYRQPNAWGNVVVRPGRKP